MPNPSPPEEERHFDVLLRTFDERRRTSQVSEIRASDPFDGEIRSATKVQLRDRALRIVETEGRDLARRQLDHVDFLLRSRDADIDGSVIAKRLLLTESPAYRSAFQKAMSHDIPAFSPEEAHAITEYRALAEGTGSSGCFGVPVLIDPSIILTSGAGDAPILRLARTVTITTDAWKGVTSAGVTWSYDAESSVVSDDSPTFAQPNIPVYTARGFVPFSLEVGDDYPGFASEMSMVLQQGYLDLVASQTAVGSGSSNPRGIFTAMQAITTNPAHVTVTTAGTLGAVDVRAIYSALPERYRSRSTWVMNQSVVKKASGFGNGNALSDYTVNLQSDGTRPSWVDRSSSPTTPLASSGPPVPSPSLSSGTSRTTCS
jgi:HK97 family phage major capsid protein